MFPYESKFGKSKDLIRITISKVKQSKGKIFSAHVPTLEFFSSSKYVIRMEMVPNDSEFLFLGPQHQDIKLMDVIVKMVCI